MAPVFFLTQQAALPSRKVLRKVIQFATALAQPIVGIGGRSTAGVKITRSRISLVSTLTI